MAGGGVCKSFSANLRFSGSLLVAAACVQLGGPVWADAGADTGTGTADLQQQITQLKQENQQIQAKLDALEVKTVASSVSGSSGTSFQKGRFALGGIDVQLGGFFDATGVYRSTAVGADAGSAFTKLPFSGGSTDDATSSQNNPLNAKNSEFRLSARETRLSVGLSDNTDSATHISAYIEGDFFGTGTTSNMKVSNSYVPRLRQAWIGYERADLGLHIFAGQQFSLLTPLASGLCPGHEKSAGPLDPNNIVGWVANVRQASIRVVKDFGSTYHLGISIENPQLTTSGTNKYNTVASYYPNGSSGSSKVSEDVAPDVVIKGAADTRYGHYEVMGIGRILRARKNVTDDSAGKNNEIFAGGMGASAYIPLIPKKLNLQLEGLWGYGVARYSTAHLGDAAFKIKDGGLKALQSLDLQGGLQASLTAKWSAFAYAGLEKIYSHSGTNAMNYLAGSSNAGCYTIGSESCSPTISQVSELTAGTWYSVYHGGAGQIKAGVQYVFLRDDTLRDEAGRNPHAIQHEVFFSLRYFPFK